MDISKIETLLKDSENDIKYIEKISNDIVSSKTRVLDEMMKAIKEDIVDADNPTDENIERYFLELTNAIYFINSQCEYLGFYEDLSKTNAKMSYNKAFSESQMKASASGKKATLAEHQISAENSSVNETLVNLIYSRSYKIIKVKLEAANEMIRTMSKILSSHMQEKQLSISSNAMANQYDAWQKESK